MLIDQHILIGF